MHAAVTSSELLFLFVTHDFSGTAPAEASARKLNEDHGNAHIYTIRDGKILEDAVMTDSLAIMQQIGFARKAWPATKQVEKY
jgi:hypothetical protein